MTETSTYTIPPAAHSDEPIVAFVDVSFGYVEGARVLDHVSFHVAAGQILCVMGLNGSGKSTLAKLCNGLLRADQGAVTVAGLDAADDANLSAIHQAVGLVFQNPDEQIVDSIVEQDVAFGPSNLGVPREELRQRIDAALNATGLDGFQKRETASLSGGQKQRLAIADALALNPRALVLDEPTSMLDPRGRRELHQLLLQLRNDGMAIVMISHDREDAAIADKVLILENGQVKAVDSASHILGDATLMARLGYELPEPQAGPMLNSKDSEPQAVPRPNCMAPESQAVPRFNSKINEYQATHACNSEVPESRAIAVEMKNASFCYNPPRARKRHGWCRSKQNSSKRTGETAIPAEGSMAIQRVSLSIPVGSFVGLVGATGSGKSTLLQLAAGLLQATGGSVLVNGTDMATKVQAASQRAAIGYLFQYPQRQLFASTVADDVAFGPKNLGWDEAAIDQAVSHALGLVGLPAEIACRSPFQLSGGQQRRVALAGVLAMKPRILLLDEPTAGLDPLGQRELMALLDDLNQHSVTILMASHNMEALERHCDTLLILKDGCLQAVGKPSLLLKDTPVLKACSLI